MKSTSAVVVLKNQDTEPAHPAFKFSFGHATPQSRGDVPEQGARPRRRHGRRRCSADDRRTQEDEVRRVRPHRSVRLAGGRHLVSRQRFPREHGLLNREIARLHQACVGRNQIPRREPHQVARDDLPQRDLLPGAVAERGGGRSDRGSQLLGRPLRAVGLPEIDADTQQDDRDDDPRIDILAEPDGNRAGREQDHDQRVGEEPRDLDHCREAACGRRLIRTIFGQASRGLGVRQPGCVRRHPINHRRVRDTSRARRCRA